MKRDVYASGLAALATTTLFGIAAADPSVPVAYCASINTASTEANSSTYQSMGLCYDFCNDDGYALGVLQDNDCWCSNYVPDSGDEVATSKCETSCPGYPDDYCGGSGLFGYIKLSAAVSGTAGGDSTTASATSTSSSIIVISTEVQTSIRIETETVQDSVTTTSSSELTSTSTSLTSTKSTETSSSLKTTTLAKTTSSSAAAVTTSSSDDDPNPATKTTITSVQTVTSAGTVIIQTVTTIADASNKGSGGLSKGAVAGLVIGILAAVAAFVAGAILYRRHKRNQLLQEQAPLAGATHRRGSSAGIMSKTGTISSSGYGLGMEEDAGYGSPGRRVSMKPMDPRLDPKSAFGLYRMASHDSIHTIRDDQDYSRRVHEPPRMLRVTNADPIDD